MAIRLGEQEFRVVLDSGVLGFDGWGWPPEILAILLHRLRPRELAVISKTVSLRPIAGNFIPQRPWETVRYLGRGNWVNAYGLTNPGILTLGYTLGAFCRRVGAPIISVIPPKPEDAERFAHDLRALPSLPVALEVNLSCPNHIHGFSLDEIAESLTKMRKVFSCPYILKLGHDQNVLEILEYLHDLHEIVHGTNSVPWATVFPNRPSPLFKFGGGGVSGPVIYPFALEFTKLVAESGYSKPIIAGGGVDNVAKALELLNAGAGAIALGTAIHTKPWLAHKIEREL